MLLSTNILAHELEDHIVYQSLQDNAKLNLAGFQIWDAVGEELSEQYLYVIPERAWQVVKRLPKGASALYCGIPPERAPSVPGGNLIAVTGLEEHKLFNKLVLIFRKYTDLDERLNKALEDVAPLQEILNLAAELIGIPLSILDMNHNTLAASTNLVAEGDALWQAVVEGYGYKHYEVIHRSVPDLAMMDTKGINLHQGISNIGGRYLRVYLLRQGTRAVASLGVHKYENGDQPFERYSIQLANYVYECLSRNVDRIPEIRKTRGNLYERMLLDLLENRVTNQQQLESGEAVSSMSLNEWYVLGMVLFQEHIPQTDYHLVLMDYLEGHIPHCKCVAYQSQIHFVCALHNGGILSLEQEEGLNGFMDQYACSCLLSSPFKGLLALSRYKDTLWTVQRYLPSKWEKNRIWYFYQFAIPYALELLSERVPLSAACHPAVLQLQEYDRKNESNYMETLREYLRCDCNVTKASSALHMHRNTLLYRINKIENQILGMKLDEPELRESLKFSFQCLYYETLFWGGSSETGRGGVRT